MENASHILFEQIFSGSTLFKNQQDLVNQLIKDPETLYHIAESDIQDYSKAQSRLKTYISQLLSDNTTRNITEDLKSGLIVLLKKKRTIKVEDAENIVIKIIEALKVQNSKNSRSEIKNSVRDQLIADLNEATYIAIITSKPLQIEIDSDVDFFSLRTFLFKDLLDILGDNTKDLKKYRFNFPMDSYGYLFWRGLRRILTEFITEHNKNNTLSILSKVLYDKFALKTHTLSALESKAQFTAHEVKKLVDEILILLNRNRFIMVFHTKAPIYGMPQIILNPTDPRNIKVYSLLEDEKNELNIFKYPEQDSILWRIFVWDKLKSKDFVGEEIPYSTDI